MAADQPKAVVPDLASKLHMRLQEYINRCLLLAAQYVCPGSACLNACMRIRTHAANNVITPAHTGCWPAFQMPAALFTWTDLLQAVIALL